MLTSADGLDDRTVSQ